MPDNFNVKNSYVLEDDIVLMCPLQKDDFDNLLPIALHEPETWKYSLVTAAGEDGLKNYMNIAFAEKEKEKEYPFIVFDKRTDEYAGSTRFMILIFLLKQCNWDIHGMGKNSVEQV